MKTVCKNRQNRHEIQTDSAQQSLNLIQGNMISYILTIPDSKNKQKNRQNVDMWLILT